jgi:hypothetical protein
MKKLPSYFLALLVISSFTTCKKDSSNGCGGSIKSYYYLSVTDKAKVPYTGTDTLVFISNTNDTAVCIGQGKKQFYEILSTPKVNGDCDPDFDYYEAYYYKFIDKNNMLNISMNVWLCDLYMCDVMDITLNSVRVYPIRTSFFYEKYYNDSAFTNQSSYKTLRINDGLGNIIQYNIKKGMIQIQSNNKIWKLYE